MTQEHPITPPPELVQEWSLDCPLDDPFNRELYVATLSARWGADQELEACCEWLQDPDLNVDTYKLRAVRRPIKSSTLKEEALQELETIEGYWDTSDFELKSIDIIRRALESLPS